MPEFKQKTCRRKRRTEAESDVPQGKVDHELDDAAQEIVEEIDTALRWELPRW